MSDEREPGAAEESQTDLEPRQVLAGEAAPPLQCGMVLAGRYEVRKVIGRGGMGLVVEALDRTLGEAVAIKILRAEYAGERTWAERLAREVKLARQIHHPNVCRVFDFAQADGRVFLIMELTSRGSLRDEIRSGVLAARPLADRIADVRALAAGLAAIHDAGIIHRDVTPQNLLRMPDGRAVLSDFGLATDSSESTTSVHGGTIAYMAPELVRGERANVASDVWALGVVSHEIVFGERPHWRPGAHEMSNPVGGRRPCAAERAVLELCRACTMVTPERRPRRVAEIAARLTETRIRHSTMRRRAARAAAVLCVGLAAAGVAGGARHWRAGARGPQAAITDPLLIIPTGEPDDWTDKSKVLAEVPEKIRCTSLLPDHRTVRFVWGRPAHAEDVDTHTGERRPSPLVPEAYAEGCPDVSPDGRRMVYAGHTGDQRAFAFVSTRADGSDGVPVVPIAEPSMNSDPTWLPDGRSFSYEVDLKNMGVFSVDSNRSTVLPRSTLASSSLDMRHVVGNQIFVSAVTAVNGDQTDVVGFSWPSLTEQVRMRLPGQVLDLLSPDGITYYYSSSSGENRRSIVEVDPVRRKARVRGSIRDQYIRYPHIGADGLSFAAIGMGSDLEVKDASGSWAQITRNDVLSTPAICGRDIVASEHLGGSIVVVRFGRRGQRLAQMTAGPFDWSPVCSSDGRALFYVDYAQHGGVRRCDGDGCRVLMKEGAGSLSISSDDKRLAFITISNRGAIVRWISTDGGETHDISESDTICVPTWSSSRAVWISHRRGRGLAWIETDADSGQATGKILPGARDCSDGLPDPASPAIGDVRIVADRRSQIRLLPEKILAARELGNPSVSR